MTHPKWKVKNLKKQMPIQKRAYLILKIRMKELRKRIRVFMQSDTDENLHAVRIALRRLRYSLEVFFDCFDQKTFLQFYSIVEHLQDISGLVRDNTIIKNKISVYMDDENHDALQKILERIDKNQKSIRDELNTELLAFIRATTPKKLMSQLKH